jgi:hypothetical protein
MPLDRRTIGPAVVLLIATALPISADDYIIPPAKKNHWAWKAPVRPVVPKVRQQEWVKNPIDAFVLTKLEAAGLTPAAPAARETLLRRVTFDLIGLPPTPAEIDAFVNDRAPDAWEKVIDRLLASPHYGERWARHWLDLVRYAESNGYEFDEPRPNAWRYRDYVIAALNQDRPFDRFVREQIAGDELYPDDVQAQIATGLHLLGPDMTDASSAAQRRQNTLDDMTDTVGLAFLGLTVGCARCHDHKFEPIPQRDFYRLQAVFTPAQFRRDIPVASAAELKSHKAALAKFQALTRTITTAQDDLEAPYRKKLHEERFAKLSDETRAAHQTPSGQRTAAQKELVENSLRRLVVTPQQVAAALSDADKVRVKELQAELKKFDKHRPAPLPVAWGLKDGAATAPKTFLLKRGELKHPGAEVLPGWPLVLAPEFKEVGAALTPLPASTGRRTALAEWLTDPAHPLTARVIVNRLWQHHFGRGIVATPNNFGVRGEPPTHPELLDWLATELVAQKWSLKQLHRLMLLSATYRQSTTAGAAALAKDPDNHLFSRMNRQRLEGEIVRDSLLALGGRLNLKVGGPSVFPPLPPEARDVKGWTVSADPKEHTRRSVYIFARRNLRYPFLEAFDLPDSNLSCPKRQQSTTAPQALAMLNAADVVEAAKALAARVGKEATTTDERVTLCYRLALGRRPSAAELRLARAFLAESPLNELCRALLNVNEFVYLD